jgi:hypothetical protein
MNMVAMQQIAAKSAVKTIFLVFVFILGASDELVYTRKMQRGEQHPCYSRQLPQGKAPCGSAA